MDAIMKPEQAIYWANIMSRRGRQSCYVVMSHYSLKVLIASVIMFYEL